MYGAWGLYIKIKNGNDGEREGVVGSVRGMDRGGGRRMRKWER